jgi:GABA permease
MAEAGVEQRGGQESHLQPGLKRRHMTMIAIGGFIGAGLFVGYTTSRMLFALTRHNDAPQFLLNTTRRGVPIWAILAGSTFGYVSVLLYYFFPEQIFTWLINASGAIALFVYLLISISELMMRRRLEREEPERLQLRMWFYPWLTYLSIAAIVAVLIAMVVIPEQRPLLIASVISAVVIIVAYLLRCQFGPPEKSPDEVAER